VIFSRIASPRVADLAGEGRCAAGRLSGVDMFPLLQATPNIQLDEKVGSNIRRTIADDPDQAGDILSFDGTSNMKISRPTAISSATFLLTSFESCFTVSIRRPQGQVLPLRRNERLCSHSPSAKAPVCFHPETVIRYSTSTSEIRSYLFWSQFKVL
jgi:hypothetical protein